MWTGRNSDQFGLGLFLLILGGILAYAAFFWETAKKVLSAEAQSTVGNFAQSKATWAFVIFLIFQGFIAAPFVEQHRWPFSYANDPQIYLDRNSLQQQLGEQAAKTSVERELADKWRFATVLRRGPLACGYQMQITSKAARTVGFWQELLQYGGWNERAGGIALAPAPGSTSSGITLRASNSKTSVQCAEKLQRALTDIYPNPASKVANNQQTEFLNSCPDCVQIEIDY